MKNRISKKLSVVPCQLSIILAFLPLSAAYAQQDSTLNRTVVVENEYNPNIMDASKINVLPRVEEPAVVKKGIEYATALRPVSAWSYESMSPITREWALNKAKRGYLRGGYGNYGNVDFKAGYVWDITKNDRLQAGVSLDGMNGTLKNLNGEDWKSRFYSTEVRLGYSHDFNKVNLDLGGGFGSQVFNYMPVPGGDGRLTTGTDAMSVTTDKQHHTRGDFHIGVSSRDESLPLQFRLQTGLQYFGIKYPLGYAAGESAGKEKIVHTTGDVWGKLNEQQQVGIRFQMDNLFYSSDSLMSNYTSLCFNPYYTLENDEWRLRIGAHIDWQSGEDSGIDVAPDVKAEYLFSDSYVLYLHALGGRELNDYRRLAAFSPYWTLSGRLASTYVPLNATAGFKASPVDGLWFNLFGGYRISKDELSCYLSAAVEGAQRKGGLYYTGLLQDKAKTAYGGAELKYGYKDFFDAALKGTFYSWKTEGENKDLYLLSKPKFELNFHAEAKVFEGLKINAAYDYVQRREYTVNGEDGTPYDAGLGNISNLSVGATYTFLKDISIFGQVNNLLNKQYYHEYGYPAEKLNVLAGLSFEF